MNSSLTKILLIAIIGNCLYLNGLAQPVFQWDVTYGGTDYEELHHIQPLYDGSIIYAGATRSLSLDSTTVSVNPCDTTLAPNFDFWLVKTDYQGNKIWDKRYGGSGDDRCWYVIPTSDGGFLLGGDSNSDGTGNCDKTEGFIGGFFDWWIVKTDKDGEVEWERTYGSDSFEELQEMIELPDGSFFLLGSGYEGLSGDFQASHNGDRDFRLMKIDSKGDYQWDKTYGGSGDDRAYKILKTAQGDYLLGGYSFSPAATSQTKTAPHWGENDFWVVKIDVDGNYIWDRTYGGTGEESLQTIEKSKEGGFFLLGQSASPEGTGNKSDHDEVIHRGGDPEKSDFYLIKVDDDGNIEWDRTYGGAEDDFGFAIYENAEDELLVGGVSGSQSSRLDPSSNKTDEAEGEWDYWMLFLEPNGDIIWDLSFGGDQIDALTTIVPVADGGVILGGHSASNKSGDKSDDNYGENDIWVIKTACQLELDLGPDTVVCEGTRLLLDAEQLNCLDCRYRWSDNARTSIRTLQPITNMDVSVKVTSRSGCEISDSISITVNDAPELLFATITPPACPGDRNGSIQILDVGGGTPPYSFSLNQGRFSDQLDYFNLAKGEFDLQIIDAKDCVADSLILLPESTPIEVFIDGGGEIQLGDSTQLIPIFSEPIDSFFWTVDPTLSCLDCLNPYAAPFETQTYSISVFNENQCKFTASTSVAILKDRPIYFPSAFSPNNDGTNDHYKFYLGNGVERVERFQIYNRWGELLYKVEDIAPGEFVEGWDGWFRGKKMPSTAYIYFMDVVFVDGWEERLQGSFVLYR